MVQSLPSSHLLDPTHCPLEALQVSPMVHASPSSQLPACPVWTQPVSAQLSSVQELPSLQMAEFVGVWTQPPGELQLSAVQATPSSHGSAGLEQPSAVWHRSNVHTLPSLQLIAACWQSLWPLQVSVVHALLSAHSASTGVNVQLPAEHASSVQPMPSSHLMATPLQTSLEQASSTVQGLPSLQVKLLNSYTHPTLALQLSLVQRSASSQMICGPVHSPPLHVSCVVQRSLSVQPVPSWTAALTQPSAGSQASFVQGLPSLQSIAALCWQPSSGSQVSVVQLLLSPQSNTPVGLHTPCVHFSPVVHESPSTQARPLFAGVKTQPVAGAQLSLVHTLKSSQLVVAPPQEPDAHKSGPVHALPSVQVLPSGKPA